MTANEEKAYKLTSSVTERIISQKTFIKFIIVFSIVGLPSVV